MKLFLFFVARDYLHLQLVEGVDSLIDLKNTVQLSQADLEGIIEPDDLLLNQSLK